MPEVVGNFLSQQQAIELAKEETKAQSLLNEGSKQDQELNILRETLAQPPGLERVFVLRYLSRTLDDEDARKWAEDEVARLDRIAQAEEEKEQTNAALQELREELDTQSTEAESAAVEALRKELDRQNAELQRLLREAGVSQLNTVAPTEIARDVNRIIIVATNDIPLSSLSAYATQNLGWSDIGEHLIVRTDGRVETARPIGKTPAVASGSNQGSIGIGVACDLPATQSAGETCPIEEEQYRVLLETVYFLTQDYRISYDQVFDFKQLRGSQTRYDYLGDLVERVRSDLKNNFIHPSAPKDLSDF
ncbi:MAG: hypothetical protein AB8B58_17570 [Roseobacter sp.]